VAFRGRSRLTAIAGEPARSQGAAAQQRADHRRHRPAHRPAARRRDHAVAAEQRDEFGDDSGRLHLPHYGLVVQYTTAVVNRGRARYGVPDIEVAPTVRDWLTGTDPVLAAALAYPQP
jgi:hypothetical protein